MADIMTSGELPTPNFSQDTSILDAQIDNSQRTYYLWLNLPDSNVSGIGAVIEYTTGGPF